MPKRIRNYVARSALLRKGGVHERSRSAKRQSMKRELEKTVSDYLSGNPKDHQDKEGERSPRVAVFLSGLYSVLIPSLLVPDR